MREKLILFWFQHFISTNKTFFGVDRFHNLSRHDFDLVTRSFCYQGSGIAASVTPLAWRECQR